MPLFQKMDIAYWTCFLLKSALIPATWRESKETVGHCPAAKANSISGDSSPARRVISCARGCVILVCVVLKSRFAFPPIRRRAFLLLMLAVSGKDILRGRSSRRSPQRLALPAGRVVEGIEGTP